MSAYKTRETIPGTLSVAERLAAGEARFVAVLMEEVEGLTREQARGAMLMMLKYKVARREGSEIRVVHGEFLDPQVIRNAVKAWEESK